jgi:hypothetical protein
MFDCLLVNGDSYSAPTHGPVYANALGKELGVPVTNLARDGSSNDRILRSTIEKVIELKEENKNPLVIIGWSFVRRLEVWYYGNNENVIKMIPDCINVPDHAKPKFVTLNNLINWNAATIEQKCLLNEDLFVHKQLTDFYTNIYLLGNTLNQLEVSWFMFSGARNVDLPVHCFPYIESLKHVKWCQEQSNIYKLHDFCIRDWAEQHDPDHRQNTGHLSKEGHVEFSKVLLTWLQDTAVINTVH